MKLDDIVPFWRNFFLSIFKPLINLKINPNFITLLSLISGICAFYFLFQNHLRFIIFALLHLYFDGLDGALARKQKRESRFGKNFDFLTDRFITFLFLLKFTFIYPWGIISILLFLINDTLNFITKNSFMQIRSLILFSFILILSSLGVIVSIFISCIGIVMHLRNFLINKKPI